MKILVACEESHAVTIELRKLGHEAYSCDIIECSGGHPEWHIRGDAIPLLNGNCGFWTVDKHRGEEWHYIDGRWDMIIAHPPCTYMSKAVARWMYPKAGVIDEKRLALALEAKAFFEKIANADCEKIAIENPRPLKVIGLTKPDQIIQPYQFGHEFSKETCLWLKGLPQLESTEVVGFYKPYCPSNTGEHSRGGGGSKGAAASAKERSKTFHGIAKEMAEQWAGRATNDQL